ncbi:hypothetical protein HZA44_00535 [Candidatus Peregrinibacteria bacterium]|nr:hypothetical protein [Candidatus Peregrinibacteria bacterium]
MFKKIAHCLALAALALQLGLFCSVGPIHAADAATPPEGNLKSTEFMFDLGGITNPAIKTGSQASWIKKGVNYFLERGITILATLAGSVAVLMMVWGGFQMITSAGEDGYKHGVETIQRAAIGLVFVLGAYLMVVTVQLLIKSIYA